MENLLIMSWMGNKDDLGRIERVVEPGEIRTDYNYGQRSETITNHIGLSATKTYNAPGWLVNSTDYDSKAVTYTHYSNGKVKTSQVNGQPATMVTIVYDINGNVTSSTDPSWGENISSYNPFGELIYSCDARGKKYTYIYDRIGRMSERKNVLNEDEITVWDYDDAGRLGLLAAVKDTKSGHKKEYYYGEFNRLAHIDEIILDELYTTGFAYYIFGRQKSLTYPGGLIIDNIYDTGTGNLKKIVRQHDNMTIWEGIDYNKHGQLTFSIKGGIRQVKEYYPETAYLKSVTALIYSRSSIIMMCLATWITGTITSTRLTGKVSICKKGGIYLPPFF